MNWLGNKPVSTVEAWNALCEAVWERMEFFQVNSGKLKNVAKLPAIPSLRKQQQTIRDMIPLMQNIIACLLAISFDPDDFGKWTPTIQYTLKPGKDSPSFAVDKFDRYAFWLEPEYLPSYRHAVADFIAAAARIVNDKIRYPLPMAGIHGSPMLGFMVDCDLYVHRYTDNTEEYGRWSENYNLPSVPGSLGIYYKHLAAWQRDKFSGRSYNHRWYYFPVMNSSGALPYTLPVLKGSCKVRSRVSATYQSDVIYSGIQEFEIDLERNCATENLDYSAASAMINKVLGGEIENENSAYVLGSWAEDCEILLNAENFSKLNYKYME